MASRREGSRRRGSRLERPIQTSSSPAVRSGGSNSAARPHARLTRASRRAGSSGDEPASRSTHAATSSGSTSSAASPATSDQRRDVRRDHRAATGHRLEHRQAEPLVARREDHRGRRRYSASRRVRSTRPSRWTRRVEAERVTSPADASSRGPGRPHSTRVAPGSASATRREGVEQDLMVLVGVGDRRIEEQRRAEAQLRGHVGRRARCRAIRGVHHGDDHDPVVVEAEAVAHPGGGELGGHRHHRCPACRSADHRPDVPALRPARSSGAGRAAGGRGW